MDTGPCRWVLPSSHRNTIMPRTGLLVGLMAAVVVAACSRSSPEVTVTPAPEIAAPTPATQLQALTRSPTTTPAPSPAPPSPTRTRAPSPTPAANLLGGLDPRELDELRETLGYALFPEYIPAGFKLSNIMVSSDRAIFVFGDPVERLLLVYPVPFSREGHLVQGIPDSPKRPVDALSDITVLGESAHLVRGQWSAETIMLGPGIDANRAKWDYDVNLTLFFDFQVSEENAVGVWIQAMDSPADWITEQELVKIAESIRRSD